jgi:hypothetical protein
MMRYVMWKSLTMAFLMTVALACGCKKTQTDEDLIRAGINQHLAGLNTLNLSAMDMDVNNISIQGTQARAQVTFRPKTGAPPGAGMQVAYQLEKRDSGWVVVKTDAVGGGIQHPPANANPHLQPGQSEVHGSLPNFREILPPTAPAAGGTLPPGHPPIDASAQNKPRDAAGKPN